MIQQFSHSDTVLFGWGAISILGEKVKELGCKKPMCVLDKGIDGTGIPEKAIKSLKDVGLDPVIFSGVVADPPIETVDEGGALAKREAVDCIVGIGGGSSMDTAKAISILLTMPGEAKDYILAKPIFVDTKTPVILVPTTAGTGSEVTSVAIISRPDVNAKWSVFVNTTYAIVDPELTLTLPKGVTANTGLDALSHAMEAMTTVNWNPHSDVYAEAAIKKIAKYLPIAVDEPSNVEARTEMMLAANFAGLAFKDPITHVGHALADALSCNFHSPHGYNCAIALPTAMELVAPAMPEKMRVIAEAMGVKLSGKETGAELGKLVADSIRALMQRVGIKPLKDYGYDRDKVLSFVPDVVSNHLSTYSPVKITEDVAKTILADIYDSYQ